MHTPIRDSLAILLLLTFLPLSLTGQERTLGPTPQQIRARKLADQWRGKNVIFILESGEDIIGRPVRATFYTLTLDVKGSRITLPIDTLFAAVLKPGPPELMLSAVAGIIGSALGYGAVDLSVPNATVRQLQTAAGVTGILATVWGLRTFYREIRYDLKGE